MSSGGFRKGHPEKIALTAELRQGTTMTMAWIAEELKAGVPQTLWRALWKKGKKAIIRRSPFPRGRKGKPQKE
jgi:hypothetical protein